MMSLFIIELAPSILGTWLWFAPGILLVTHLRISDDRRSFVEYLLLSLVSVLIVQVGLMEIFHILDFDISTYKIGLVLLSGILGLLLLIRIDKLDAPGINDSIRFIIALVSIFSLLGIMVAFIGSSSSKSYRTGSTAFYLERPHLVVGLDSNDLPKQIVLTIENKDNQTNTYSLEVHVNGEIKESLQVGLLLEKEHKSINIDLTHSEPGPFIYEFLLYKDDQTQPYRRLAIYLIDNVGVTD